MKRLALTILILYFANPVFSCQELIWSPAEYAINSKQVYIGLVTVIAIPEPGKPVDINTYVNSKRFMSDINVSIKIIKTLKGNKIDTIQIPLNWCGGGEYELGDLVAVYNLGEFWHVKNAKPAINQTIKALATPSK